MSKQHERIPDHPSAVMPLPNDDIPARSDVERSPDEETAALAAWRAFEQGALSEAPMALAAWLDHQRFSDAR